MVICGFFQTVEFYVILSVVAAAVVALAALPAKRGEARLLFYAGDLEAAPTGAEASEPMLYAECRDDGAVVLRREGVRGITASGAVSLAVTVIGFDVTIQERLSAGYSNDEAVTAAVFVLDFFAPERYHVTYRSDDAGLFGAFTLANRPGLRIAKRLL